jgi:hypothetical protein
MRANGEQLRLDLDVWDVDAAVDAIARQPDAESAARMTVAVAAQRVRARRKASFRSIEGSKAPSRRRA